MTAIDGLEGELKGLQERLGEIVASAERQQSDLAEADRVYRSLLGKHELGDGVSKIAVTKAQNARAAVEGRAVALEAAREQLGIQIQDTENQIAEALKAEALAAIDAGVSRARKLIAEIVGGEKRGMRLAGDLRKAAEGIEEAGRAFKDVEGGGLAELPHLKLSLEVTDELRDVNPLGSARQTLHELRLHFGAIRSTPAD